MMQIVTPESFPHGVRCGVCREVIDYWNVYMTALDSMTGDGVAVETIRCIDCT